MNSTFFFSIGEGEASFVIKSSFYRNMGIRIPPWGCIFGVSSPGRLITPPAVDYSRNLKFRSNLLGEL